MKVKYALLVGFSVFLLVILIGVGAGYAVFKANVDTPSRFLTSSTDTMSKNYVSATNHSTITLPTTNYFIASTYTSTLLHTIRLVFNIIINKRYCLFIMGGEVFDCSNGQFYIHGST